MEWIAPFLLAFLAVSTFAQLFWAYTLSAIAQKDGQSDLMQVLAWIPILQLAPMIVAGGGSVQGFLLGAIGLVIGAVVLGMTSAFLGGMVGGAIGSLGMVFALLLTLVYFARLSWRTALGRNLPGWVGLLLFLPIVNFFVYPYIAFHDGWSAPNKVGLVVGLVLIVGSAMPSFQAVQRMNQAGGMPPEFAALLAGDAALNDLLALDAFETPALESSRASANSNIEGIEIDPAASIKALYSMQGRFERLGHLVESQQIARPEHRQQALNLLNSIELELKAHRGVIDAQTYQQLTMDLVRSEARIHEMASAGPNRAGGISRAQKASRQAKAFASNAPGPAAIQSFSSHSSPPIRPIPVQAADDCPDGTELRTRAHSEEGDEEWCQQLDEHGGLRHGWYAHYLANGQPESMGEYSSGLRVGVWTRFYSSGRVRAQAQFSKGLQHGWLLSFDEEGQRTKAVRFDQGVAVP
jgi:uncharacterized membrane protein YhaH (DUF805 family)